MAGRKLTGMDKLEFLWSGTEPLNRIFVVGTLAYISIILIVRISGARTLATMNAFDFIITVTLGSAFGRILTAKGVALSEAILAFVLLVALQFIVSTIESHSKFFKELVTSKPRLLFLDGEFDREFMKKSRLNREDLMGAVRKKGFISLNQVKAIILETDGTFSVLEKSDQNENLTYENLL